MSSTAPLFYFMSRAMTKRLLALPRPLTMFFALATAVFAATILFTLAVRALARRFGIVDHPSAERRKIHTHRIPLMGGTAIYAALVLVAGAVLIAKPELLTRNMSARALIFAGLGGFVLMLGGYLDDRYRLSARYQMIFPVVAVLLALFGGIHFAQITNPFGGVVRLDTWRIGSFLLPGDVIAFVWLLGMAYTTKLLDGLDGLAGGVVGIGAVMIAALALYTKFYQPDVALLALLLAAACAAFLVYNFHPASIFLGEGGSLFLGYALGILAIIAGGKIATTLLVMGFAVLDVVWVIARRAMSHQRITISDAGHLHHRLLRRGFTHRGAVVFMYAVAACFGILALFLQSGQKVVALGVLMVCMVGLAFWLTRENK